MEKKIFKSLLCFLILLINHNMKAQNIVKINRSELSKNEVLNTKLSILISDTDINHIKTNGDIKYGTTVSKIIQFDINSINYINNLNLINKSEIEYAIINVASLNGKINLLPLNSFTALNFIYIIVENDISENAFTNLVNADNPNWTIAYEFSLPE